MIPAPRPQIPDPLHDHPAVVAARALRAEAERAYTDRLHDPHSTAADRMLALRAWSQATSAVSRALLEAGMELRRQALQQREERAHA